MPTDQDEQFDFLFTRHREQGYAKRPSLKVKKEQDEKPIRQKVNEDQAYKSASPSKESDTASPQKK